MGKGSYGEGTEIHGQHLHRLQVIFNQFSRDVSCPSRNANLYLAILALLDDFNPIEGEQSSAIGITNIIDHGKNIYTLELTKERQGIYKALQIPIIGAVNATVVIPQRITFCLSNDDGKFTSTLTFQNIQHREGTPKLETEIPHVKYPLPIFGWISNDIPAIGSKNFQTGLYYMINEGGWKPNELIEEIRKIEWSASTP